MKEVKQTSYASSSSTIVNYYLLGICVFSSWYYTIYNWLMCLFLSCLVSFELIFICCFHLRYCIHELFVSPPGGYKGDKDGYAIPAGTDLFISVSTNIRSFLFLLWTDAWILRTRISQRSWQVPFMEQLICSFLTTKRSASSGSSPHSCDSFSL